MSFTVYIAMFGWIPIVLALFALLPPARAVIVSFVASWLFLPVARFPLPGFPDYTKVSAPTIGVLFAMAVFDSRRLFALRPRWFDVPMLVWCLCPIASSVTNGLGPYDGFSEALGQIVNWGFPYVIGRAYFDNFDGLQALATGLVIGGLAYVPLCLWEIQMSPQLHRIVYGFAPSSFGMTIRYGEYRPMVFMQHGLELGMWMAAASLAGITLWWSGRLKRMMGLPFGAWLLILLATSVLCKSTGALVLLAIGASVLQATRWKATAWVVWLLVVVAPLYEATRATGVWSGRNLVELSRSCFGEERAQSLEFRIDNEDILIAKAIERPLFGWGGWGRARVYDKDGRDLSITDGYWIIALGNMGVVGLAALTTVCLLPLVLLWVRCPVRSWTALPVAPAAALAVLLGLYMIDNLSNAMFNPIYVLAIGGLTALKPNRGRGRPAPHATSAVASRFAAVAVLKKVPPGAVSECRDSGRFSDLPHDVRGQALTHWRDPEASAEALAREYQRFGRFLLRQGVVRDAIDYWQASLDLLEKMAVARPDHPESKRRWLDAQNDLAWIFLTLRETNPGLAARGLSMAKAVVGHAPHSATYWNTLGIAHYRNGDLKEAIAALETSIDRGAGGTSFDFFVLAMACWSRGDEKEARLWFERAERWMKVHRPEHEGLVRLRSEAAALLELNPSLNR